MKRQRQSKPSTGQEEHHNAGIEELYGVDALTDDDVRSMMATILGKITHPVITLEMIENGDIGEFDCIIHQYSTVKKTGYAQMRQLTDKESKKGGTGKKRYVHILACIFGNDFTRPQGDLEASHRCWNAKCVNPNHLCFEAGDVNKTRGCCQLFHATDRYRCPHKPKCICQGIQSVYE